jgi:hemolysin activation/secretion protein
LEDRITAFSTDNDRDVSSLTLRVSGTRSDGWGVGGLFGFSASVAAGDVELKSPLQEALDSGPGGYGTAGGFSRFNLSGWRLQALPRDWSILASVRAQFSLGGNLDTSEKSLMGGPNGIRAYPVSETAGDESVLGTVELRWDWRTLPWRGSAQFFGFADAGSSRLRAEPLAVDVDNRRSLHALGFGARLGAGERWELSGTVAWRGSEISQEDPTSGRMRAFVTATTRF